METWRVTTRRIRPEAAPHEWIVNAAGEVDALDQALHEAAAAKEAEALGQAQIALHAAATACAAAGMDAAEITEHVELSLHELMPAAPCASCTRPRP